MQIRLGSNAPSCMGAFANPSRVHTRAMTNTFGAALQHRNIKQILFAAKQEIVSSERCDNHYISNDGACSGPMGTMTMALAFAFALPVLMFTQPACAVDSATINPLVSNSATTTSAPTKPQTGLWNQLDPNRATVTQSVYAVCSSVEGLWIARFVGVLGLLYISTRQPDPPSKESQEIAYGPLQKSWLLTAQGATEVDTAIVAQIAASAAIATRDATAAIATRHAAAVRGKAEGSPEPGVLAVGMTAAAIEAFAPLGRFFTSDLRDAVAAATRISHAGNGTGSTNGVPLAITSPSPSHTPSSSPHPPAALPSPPLPETSPAPDQKNILSNGFVRFGFPGKRSITPSPSPVPSAHHASSAVTAVLVQKTDANVIFTSTSNGTSITSAIRSTPVEKPHTTSTTSNSAPGLESTSADAIATTGSHSDTTDRVTSVNQIETDPSASYNSWKLLLWAIETVRKGRALLQEAKQTQHPTPTPPPALPTPLNLNPVYPPSRPNHPRPVSLTAAFRGSGTSDAVTVTGVAGSAPVNALQWTSERYDAPPIVPVLDLAVLEAATVSSVVKFNLALSTRRPLPELTAATAAAVTTTARSSNNAVTGAIILGDDEDEVVSSIVSRNLSAAVEATAAMALAQASAVSDQNRAISVEVAAAATAAVPDGSTPPMVNDDGMAQSTTQGTRPASANTSYPGNLSAPPRTEQEAQAAVARWTDMIKSSPETAVDAVAEVRAVAEALVTEVRSELDEVSSSSGAQGQRGGSGVEDAGGAADAVVALAAATADALQSHHHHTTTETTTPSAITAEATDSSSVPSSIPPQPPRTKFLPWFWAWSVRDVPTFLDPIRQLLTFNPPTARSKYDPLSDLKNWRMPAALPAWDPLARLHTMVNKGFQDSGIGASRNSSQRKAPKYDAIAQLVKFVATLPEVVESSEWAAASARDPLRFLIAEAAGRPASTVLEAHVTAAGKGPAGARKSRKSRWSKYDPLADLFSPEVPLGARWDEVVVEMLALEAVSGTKLKRFSPLQVMTVRGGQAFQSALLDFKRMTVLDDSVARLHRVHPGICTWLQSAGNVSLATVASGTKLGPVWGVLLLPNYQRELLAARGAFPAFMRESERRHPGLWSLLNGRDPEQALVLLATLASWVVSEEMMTSGKPLRSLSPGPHSPQEAEAVEAATRLAASNQAAATAAGFATGGRIPAAGVSPRVMPASSSPATTVNVTSKISSVNNTDA